MSAPNVTKLSLGPTISLSIERHMSVMPPYQRNSMRTIAVKRTSRVKKKIFLHLTMAPIAR